ncbi:hypothetical protein LZ496_03990 [Sphingomonas sp. NSE70-1]|uniref:SnoaL-like domain-containing protein n=1 Tax=Sphingomonas caseinilyticus TaxID=2908205 RepID=A0ABT0RSH1_9SPHN|nr:hypothetical protein [Sphingomonas caseinilyticus]MCL6697945.1 hypothetical protein [Sphingomonas caseinilyticus]
MIMVAVAASLAASPACPAADAKAELLAMHEKTRQAHLQGEGAAIAENIGDRLLMADNGTLRTQSKADVEQFFTGYLKRVRYSEWRDVSSPVVTISPDGQMAWMAVEVAAKYTRADKPAEGEKNFKSSWIATYARDNCAWRMTGIASDVVE